MTEAERKLQGGFERLDAFDRAQTQADLDRAVANFDAQKWLNERWSRTGPPPRFPPL